MFYQIHVTLPIMFNLFFLYSIFSSSTSNTTSNTTSDSIGVAPTAITTTHGVFISKIIMQNLKPMESYSTANMFLKLKFYPENTADSKSYYSWKHKTSTTNSRDWVWTYDSDVEPLMFISNLSNIDEFASGKLTVQVASR